MFDVILKHIFILGIQYCLSIISLELHLLEVFKLYKCKKYQQPAQKTTNFITN